MELRLGLPKHDPQWLCLVGSNPTLLIFVFRVLGPFSMIPGHGRVFCNFEV